MISSISASDVANKTLNSHKDNNILSDDSEETPDVPDLIEDVSNNVTPTNFGVYFQNGVLNDKYKDETLLFNGNFENLNQLTIKSDNVKIIGNGAIFKNTVFNIESNGVILKNLKFDSNRNIKSNDGAVIRISGENCNLVNLTINYIVPNDVEAYAIFADGYNSNPADCLKIINSTIYFEGHNVNVNRYNCAIKLTCVDSLLIENNTVTTSLPLKNVDYGPQGATIDSDYVYTIGIEECDNFIINNNTIVCDVNKRPAVSYPTLNCVMISKSDNGLFSNNSIFMTDFVTFPGIENYLYGLDIYNLNDLVVINNKISIITTGGKLALGTAYPIQICGPISGINITLNDLYSFSNGPNIGIYSQNYYGPTDLSITFNKINVTGLAGVHEWALVTGIESQDTNAEILNNYIEVHSVGPVSVNDNLYAISYRQSTAGSHTFNIQNNFAMSNGYYAVYLLSSDDSTIFNNTLISSNGDVSSGDNSYKQGPRNHNGDFSRENRVITILDYYKSKNNIDVTSNSNSFDNSIISGGSISWNNYNNQQRPNGNPLVPHYSNIKKDSPANPIDGSDENNNYIDDGSVQGRIYVSDKKSDLKHETSSENDEFSYVEATSYGDVGSDGFNLNSYSNGSDVSPSLNGNDNSLSGSQSSDGSASSQSVSKSAYELDETVKDKEKFIPSVFLVVLILLLLVIGYKRKNSSFD
ncbi:hypothetical protein [uncultured Methanobrevibacter sp.]|uniref:hypothetical protein n=1 Tax=uncultured Methanobrevibacter sp. TaxID=253161 RepID=UPI0025F78FBF|nr:hypothetical protein [uncultured Methanobrevibacter sp.]